MFERPYLMSVFTRSVMLGEKAAESSECCFPTAAFTREFHLDANFKIPPKLRNHSLPPRRPSSEPFTAATGSERAGQSERAQR